MALTRVTSTGADRSGNTFQVIHFAKVNKTGLKVLCCDVTYKHEEGKTAEEVAGPEYQLCPQCLVIANPKMRPPKPPKIRPMLIKPFTVPKPPAIKQRASLPGQMGLFEE